MKLYCVLLLLTISFTTLGQTNDNLRGPDSTKYTLIDASQCLCQQPQYFFTLKTPKGDTVKIDIMVSWDAYSRYWEIKTLKDGHISSLLKPGTTFWMKDSLYLFNEEYIFKIYRK